MAKTAARGGVRQAATRKSGSAPGPSDTTQPKTAAAAGKNITMRAKADPAPSTRRSAGAISVPSKDELRAQVEKLQRLTASLRAKNKDLKRAAGTADARVAELQAEVRRLERRVSREARQQSAEDRPMPERDPGDAVPSGVAVRDPAPLSEEERAVLEHLNQELSPE